LDLVSFKKKTLLVLGFYLVLIPSKFYHASYGEIFPKTPPPTLVQPKHSVQTNKIHFWILFQLFLFPKIILSFLLSLGDLQSKYPNAFDF